jgi:hypothetical protein
VWVCGAGFFYEFACGFGLVLVEAAEQGGEEGALGLLLLLHYYILWGQPISGIFIRGEEERA